MSVFYKVKVGGVNQYVPTTEDKRIKELAGIGGKVVVDKSGNPRVFTLEQMTLTASRNEVKAIFGLK